MVMNYDSQRRPCKIKHSKLTVMRENKGTKNQWNRGIGNTEPGNRGIGNPEPGNRGIGNTEPGNRGIGNTDQGIEE